MRFCCASFVAGLLAACVLQARAELANGIKAVVHDSIVTIEDVESLTDPARVFLQRKYRTQPELLQKELDKVRKDNLETLVDRQLILHDFNTAGYNLPESVVDALVDEEIRAEYSDRKTLTKTLQAQGRTYEKFRQRVRDKFIERALRAKNISQEIIISPHKVEAFYQAHREDFKVEDEVKLRLLTLPQSTAPGAPAAKKMADEILLKLKEGATFAEMAALYSLAKQEGVWYEWSTLTKHLADIAAPMQAGQHTGVMSRSAGEDDYWVCRYENGQATQGRHYGISGSKERLMEEVRFDSGSSSTSLPPPKEYFLMLLEDKRAAHYKPLNEVRTKIEGEFTLQERARLEKQWMERLKKKTFVRVFPGG